MQNCKLCLVKEADKPNSHIIPKFLGKRIFSSNPRYSIKVDRKGKSRKIQDISKESNILCKDCEKRLSHLETLNSRKITSINNYNNLKNKFELTNYGKNKILECLNINPIGFKIFLYSMVWRCSISNLPEFESFELDTETEAELRFFLVNILKNSHTKLINAISQISEFPNYDYCMFKPLFRNDNTIGIFTAYRVDKFQFGIFTGDFIFFFFSNSKDIHPAYKLVSNYQNQKVIITLAGTDDWNSLNEIVIRKMLK